MIMGEDRLEEARLSFDEKERVLNSILKQTRPLDPITTAKKKTKASTSIDPMKGQQQSQRKNYQELPLLVGHSAPADPNEVADNGLVDNFIEDHGEGITPTNLWEERFQKMEQESDGNALREFSTPKLNPETRDFEEELERIKQETTKGWANFGSKFSNDEERMGVIQDFTSILGILFFGFKVN